MCLTCLRLQRVEDAEDEQWFFVGHVLACGVEFLVELVLGIRGRGGGTSLSSFPTLISE